MIWFMEGLSSQRDILKAVRKALPEILVTASHSRNRPEILVEASLALLEPQEDELRLNFIFSMVKQMGITCIHVGKNCQWYEHQRKIIENMGVSLITGALSPLSFDIANNKIKFAEVMLSNNLSVVPSILIEDAELLSYYIKNPPFEEASLCIKPVNGIYGMGFWIFDLSVNPMQSFIDPYSRRVHPASYLDALRRMESFSPLILMPYLPGPERSIDMIVENGNVIALVSRRKEGSFQYFEKDGAAVDLAIECAKMLQADGLVNIQTRNDVTDHSVLLEANLRPSGGIGYGLHSGINLPALFVQRRLGFEVTKNWLEINNNFKHNVVRIISEAQPISDITYYNIK